MPPEIVISGDEILAEGLMLDEREYHPLEEATGQLQEAAAVPVAERGAAVFDDLRPPRRRSEPDLFDDLAAGSRSRGEEAARTARAAADAGRVGDLGLLVEARSTAPTSTDQLAQDARDFGDMARGALAVGIADERLIAELRRLLAEAEPVVRRNRAAEIDGALAGDGRRRRRPRSVNVLEELGLDTMTRGGR